MSKIVKRTKTERTIPIQIRHTVVETDDGQCYLISSTVTTDHGLETMVFSCKRSADVPDEYSVDWGELWSAHYTDWHTQLWEHEAIADNFELFKSNELAFKRLNDATPNKEEKSCI